MLKCSFYTSSCHEWVTILHNKGILLVYEEFLRNPYCFCLVIYFGSLDGICVVGKAHAVEMCKNKHSLNVFYKRKWKELNLKSFIRKFCNPLPTQQKKLKFAFHFYYNPSIKRITQLDRFHCLLAVRLQRKFSGSCNHQKIFVCII